MPAKERFIEENKRYRFNSYSFGTIYTKTGPSIIDEAIDYIQAIDSKYQRNPVKWNNLLFKNSSVRLSGV